ncbi:DUF916 and DUF3324 domain-containing protein [Enterococcus haemoperoxidus]|nr:DUF916 and DUF3324 domain-containing protein [Enterococcus haemoperoxidus]OJG52601.1 hypothetical protein RV06_GL000909 [Enterococcus haemoperoxidus]
MYEKILYCLFLGIACLFICPTIVFSDESAKNPIKDFSYEVVFPENQQNKNVGYYDLLMKPGEKQTIQLKMHNISDKPLKVAIDLNSAKTNGNGVIEYGPTDLKKDVSLNYDLAQIMTGPKEVTLKPNSTEIVEFVITLPEVAFEGYLAGGIQLKPIVKEEHSQEESIIINKFAFLIGVLIHESNTEKIKPVLKLNDVSLKLKDGSYSLFVDLSNTKGVFVEKMAAAINIRKNNSSKNLIKFNKQDMRMAPNSAIAIPVSLQNQKITAGEYTADIRITTADGGNWTWVKNFTFTRIEAEQINRHINQNDQSYFSGWWVLLFSTLLIITLLLFFLRKKKRSA